MKPPSLIIGLLAACLGMVPTPSASAIEFPIEYSGHYHLSVGVKNQFGSGECSDLANLTITLRADGQLDYDLEELEVFIETPSKRPPTCDIRLTGQIYHLVGTHDGRQGFSVPSESPSFPAMTGSFDEDHIIAEYRIGSFHFAFDLPKSVSHRITIEPDPSKGFDFHLGILEKKGFKIVMRDPHGKDHLDFNSLRIIVGGSDTVAGTDTTQHVLRQLLQGIVPYAEESPDSRTKVFRIKPDPRYLMPDLGNPDPKLQHPGQDVFAIPFNGNWRIELRICDKAQTCFNTVYRNVYFGPFVISSPVLNVVDGRCTKPGDSFVQVTSVKLGNIGIDSPKTAIYVALAKPELKNTWTYYVDDFGDGTATYAWWQGKIMPFITELSIPSGTLLEQSLFLFPDWIAVPDGTGLPYQRKVPFPDGTYTFISAALDKDTGALFRDEHQVVMCDR